MGLFVFEARYLILELYDFTLALDERGLFRLQIECLRIDNLVEVVEAAELLRNVVLEGTSLRCQILTLFLFEDVLVADLV